MIVLFLLLGLFGSFVIPDKSVNANQTITQLRKLSPGASVLLLKIDKPFTVEKKGWLETLMIGGVEQFNFEPIDSYLITDDLLLVCSTEYGNETFDFREDYYNTLQNELKSSKEGFGNWLVSERIIERKYLLGTDSAGRDVFSRLVYGAKVSVSVGVMSVMISIFIGVIVGAFAGYFGGWIDDVLTWLITVIWSIPGIMLIIAISMALNSKGIWVVFFAVGLTMWVDVARVVRGQVMESKENLYVEAAKALGVPVFRIIWKHILPNISGPIIVIATANFAAAILVEAGLSFIGIGVEPPTPSWGSMVREGYDMMGGDIVGGSGALTLLLWPSLCISFLVFAFNLLGNGLRDLLDPKNAISG